MLERRTRQKIIAINKQNICASYHIYRDTNIFIAFFNINYLKEKKNQVEVIFNLPVFSI